MGNLEIFVPCSILSNAVGDSSPAVVRVKSVQPANVGARKGDAFGFRMKNNAGGQSLLHLQYGH